MGFPWFPQVFSGLFRKCPIRGTPLPANGAPSSLGALESRAPLFAMTYERGVEKVDDRGGKGEAGSNVCGEGG
jgi:hypothetical protein